MKPIIITPGEPAGIGPDIVIQLTKHRDLPEFVVMADRHFMQTRAKQLGLSIEKLPILHTPLIENVIPGTPSLKNAEVLLSSLKYAAEGCQKGDFSALVTGPLNKAVINQAGIAFRGHTEYLAEVTQTKRTVMMLANPALKVALATTHISLREVSDHITIESLTECLEILYRDLQQKFHIQNPVISVCGLNPHAGEQGILGDEEQTVIIPVLEKLRQQGMKLIGPVPADTAFIAANLKNMDTVVAMYHDQGLPVIKALNFQETVNVTLGLPIIRTSVDHGTAFDLAGTGKADERNLISALHLAATLAS